MSADPPTRTLRGTVTRLFHSSPTFCAGRLRPASGQTANPAEISFAGKVFVREGEAVALTGRWEEHEKYGRQFRAEARLYEEGLDAGGLAAWLAHHGSAAGIGPMKAKRIAEELGENFAGVLKDNPEQIAIEYRLKLEDVKALATAWGEREEENAIGTRLAAFGLTHNEVHALYERFGGATVCLLQEDPYAILGHVPGVGFKRADAIAKKLGTSETSPGRLKAAALYVLGKASEDGHTCVERRRLIDDTVEALEAEQPGVVTLVKNAIDDLVAEKKQVRQATSEESGLSFVALRRMWAAELSVATFFEEAGGVNPHFPAEVANLTAVRAVCPNLDEWQAEAVLLALTRRCCLITGGAGSGKSTVIAALADLYRRHDLRVRLAAPTGKAARRLEEVTGGRFEACTIHRLLCYSARGGGFLHHVGNPVPGDVVIVDEASMIDAPLASSLLSAIDGRTAVVMVGDPNQLPPVGPGAVLRDALARSIVPAAVLEHCHRQAGPLKRNCAAVLEGRVEQTVTEDDGSFGPWVVHRKLYRPDDVLAAVEKLFGETLLKRFGFDPARDVQFLSPQHKGPLGTLAVNALLQRLHQRTLGVTVPPAEPDARPRLHIGDRVIQTRNNYDLDVMNGHQGVVLQVTPLIVEFDGRAVAVPNDCRGDVELAYCLTPHKCQGSEFPCAVVVCHSGHRFMLHRSWIYTAVTRAKKVCVILGDEEGVRTAAETVRSDSRATLLPLLAGGRHEFAG